MAKKVLGRGLGAFFPDYNENENEDESGKKSDQNPKIKTAVPIEPEERLNVVLDVPVAHIRPNPHQPRKEFKEVALEELADSIKKHGLIQPITVRYLGEKRFELISGERRLRASKLAGLEAIPSYIREANDEQIISFALIENIQREQLNPLEVAMGYHRLMEECNYTQGEVAEKVGKNRTTVTNMIRLLQLPDFIQAALRDEQISTGHARSLINLKSEEDQQIALKKIVSKSLSVRQTEELVRSFDKKRETGKKNSKRKEVSNPFADEIEKRLRTILSTKVKVKPKAKGGTIQVDYYSNNDLERILQLLDEAG